MELDSLVDRGGRRQEQRQGQGRERNPGEHGMIMKRFAAPPVYLSGC
jgi:hypothetical protein